jgi:HEAT repeat protein
LGLGAATAAALYVVTHPQTSHNPINLDFLLDPLSKSEFLSFPNISGFPEAVVRALFDGKKLVRRSAVYALADFAIVPDEAAAALGGMIIDKSLSSRILPLLVDMGERAAPAVPYLAEALESKEGKIAYNAAFALSRIGTAAAPAVNELTTALDHRDKYVRRYSAQDLGGCGSAAVEAIPALIELQQDPDPHVSSAARSAIARIRNAQEGIAGLRHLNK